MQCLYPRIFIVNCLDLRLLKRWRGHDPRSPFFFWNGEESFVPMLRLAATASGEVVVQDALLPALEAALPGVGLTALSRECPTWTAALARLPSASSLSAEKGPVLFCPSNDTHARMFHLIARRLRQAEFLHFHVGALEENTESTLQELGVPYQVGGSEALSSIRPSVLVFGNDWNQTGPPDRVGLAHAAADRSRRQEGCLDFGTQLGRMERCDWPLVLGPVTPHFLPHHAYFLTGNPRFDNLKPKPLPAEPLVMINCNFTYGVHEDIRERWVRRRRRTAVAWGWIFSFRFIREMPVASRTCRPVVPSPA